jgi:hypothetical protein
MQTRGKPRSAGQLADRLWVLIIPGILASATACQERERLTFPNQSDGIGPITLIDHPEAIDTTVDPAPQFLVSGRTIDTNGVDTVYFLVGNGNQGFPPFIPSPPTDTVRFGLPISTAGHSGDTIQVEIHGVDSEGNRGPDATRRIFVR